VVRTGRRPGNPDTREAILAAAREAFADRGFDAASIRSIAAAAGVDPALVHHYFGTKDQLFLDSMQAPFDPGEALHGVLAKGVDGAGERLVRMIMGIWDSPAGGAASAIIRSAVSNDLFARMMREFITHRVLRRIAKDLDVPREEGLLRANLVASQIAGLIMVRYIVKIEPLASAPVETVVGLIGPNVQHYLTGDLGGVSAELGNRQPRRGGPKSRDRELP
jgi:AcrR family transcriptional regulator